MSVCQPSWYECPCIKVPITKLHSEQVVWCIYVLKIYAQLSVMGSCSDIAPHCVAFQDFHFFEIANVVWGSRIGPKDMIIIAVWDMQKLELPWCSGTSLLHWKQCAHVSSRKCCSYLRRLPWTVQKIPEGIQIFPDQKKQKYIWLHNESRDSITSSNRDREM